MKLFIINIQEPYSAGHALVWAKDRNEALETVSRQTDVFSNYPVDIQEVETSSETSWVVDADWFFE